MLLSWSRSQQTVQIGHQGGLSFSLQCQNPGQKINGREWRGLLLWFARPFKVQSNKTLSAVCLHLIAESSTSSSMAVKTDGTAKSTSGSRSSRSCFTKIPLRSSLLKTVRHRWSLRHLILLIMWFIPGRFKIQRQKESTGRVVFWNMGITYSYTLEASYGGTNMGSRAFTHFNTEDYEGIGRYGHCHWHLWRNDLVTLTISGTFVKRCWTSRIHAQSRSN